MSKRLYLTNRDRYRVRTVSGAQLHVTWSDARGTFFVPKENRALRLDRIVEVAPFASDGHAEITWTPSDDCFLAKHKPTTKSAWVHPYGQAVAK